MHESLYGDAPYRHENVMKGQDSVKYLFMETVLVHIKKIYNAITLLKSTIYIIESLLLLKLIKKHMLES